MMVVLFVASLTAGAAGNWWLAAGFWLWAVIIGTRKVRAESRAIDAHPSQLRARQLEHIANRDRVR